MFVVLTSGIGFPRFTARRRHSDNSSQLLRRQNTRWYNYSVITPRNLYHPGILGCQNSMLGFMDQPSPGSSEAKRAGEKAVQLLGIMHKADPEMK